MKYSPITKIEQSKFLELFSHYKAGYWIYPGALHRKTHISIKNVYKLLDKAEKEEIVESYFVIVCEECNENISGMYRKLDDMPEEYVCDNCGNIGKIMDNTILIYRMLDDEQNR